VLHTVATVRGVARALIDRAGEIPQLHIEIDRHNTARYGLNVADIQDLIEIALGGRAATEIWEGEKRFGVVVRLREDDRRDISSIENILLDTPGGLRIPLKQVAYLSIHSELTPCSRNTKLYAALRVFPIFTFTLCSTWFVMTRNRNACCS
jgi:heavy metal efflux system protein